MISDPPATPSPTTLAAATLTALRTRRSVRRYTDKPVPRALVEQLLDAARFAPSAHHRQPWRFLVIDEPSRKAALADAMAARLVADRTADGDAASAIADDAARSRARLTQAPVLILASLTTEELDHYPDPARQEAERIMAVQGVAMATHAVLLAAHAMGLGACWMCAPLFCPETVRALLALPAAWQPQALITMGYSAAPGRERLRKPLDEIVAWGALREPTS